MEEVIQFEFEWLELRHKVKDTLKIQKLPDLNAVLLFIGVQEMGKLKSIKTKKEEKQDLMHIGICTLLEHDGFYQWDGLDTDGWPHFKKLKNFEIKGVEEQERYLKTKAIEYFNQIQL